MNLIFDVNPSTCNGSTSPHRQLPGGAAVMVARLAPRIAVVFVPANEAAHG
jgi:hypothetical protein